MRNRFWRRIAATLALIVGLGVAAPVASASAATSTSATSVAPASSAPSHGMVAYDWWWGP
jgi:hypothetical protein